VPVQFSCHALGPGGSEHHAWLADGAADPREEFARALVSACAKAKTIVAYNAPFERRCVDALSEAVYEEAERAAILSAERGADGFESGEFRKLDENLQHRVTRSPLIPFEGEHTLFYLELRELIQEVTERARDGETTRTFIPTDLRQGLSSYRQIATSELLNRDLENTPASYRGRPAGGEPRAAGAPEQYGGRHPDTITQGLTMAITRPDRYHATREVLRALEPPFLLRHYDASPEDYEAIADEDLKCEYLDGELIVHAPASIEHEDLTAFLLSLLREFVTARGVGRAFGSNAVMQLGAKRLSPDVSVLLTQNRERQREGRVYGPMDLVVEVISRSTRTYDFQTKLPVYREARVPEIWLVDAERRQFEAHALQGEDYRSRVLGTGPWPSVALAGLVVEVDWFWRDPRPSVGACLHL
jgi:Uma2 family endonuclease